MDAGLILQNWEVYSAAQKSDFRKILSQHINDLLLHNFEGLVQLLYRVDVSEEQIKKTVAANGQSDAGELIADLLIKRQEEKIALRQSFPPANNLSDDERW